MSYANRGITVCLLNSDDEMVIGGGGGEGGVRVKSQLLYPSGREPLVSLSRMLAVPWSSRSRSYFCRLPLVVEI
jgi:hypothetical protein